MIRIAFGAASETLAQPRAPKDAAPLPVSTGVTTSTKPLRFDHQNKIAYCGDVVLGRGLDALAKKDGIHSQRLLGPATVYALLAHLLEQRQADEKAFKRSDEAGWVNGHTLLTSKDSSRRLAAGPLGRIPVNLPYLNEQLTREGCRWRLEMRGKSPKERFYRLVPADEGHPHDAAEGELPPTKRAWHGNLGLDLLEIAGDRDFRVVEDVREALVGNRGGGWKRFPSDED